MTNSYYDNPKGFFKYILAMDSETTGLNFDEYDPSIGHQAVSWGFIVADSVTLEPVEELYLEVKWNDQSLQARKDDPDFSVSASAIHGLTFEYLEKNGITEEEAVVQLATLILKYWGPNRKISCLGHNVRSFDIPFLQAMLKRYNVDIPFNSRHCDSHSVGFATIGSYTSDSMFDTMACDERDNHNALEDAHMSLTSCRRIKTLWTDIVGVKAND